jgi:hypothetical protein
MSATFLEPNEICELTGRKMKSKQIDALRRAGLPFFVNATGHPIVARATIEGRTAAPQVLPSRIKPVPRLFIGN